MHLGGAIFDSSFSLNHAFLILFCSWGLVGVFVFVIVSSYFLIDSQEIKLNKLLTVVFSTSLYSFMTFLFSCIYSETSISAKGIIKAILSPALNSYWYITGYVVLYLLHPILNVVIKKLSTRELAGIAVAGFVLCFGYKYVFVAAPIETFGLFLTVYFGVALFKRVQGRINYRIVYLCGWLSAFAVVFLGLLHALLYSKISILKYIYSQSISKYSPFMLIIAFALFCACISKKPSNSKVISLLSKAVLPVYLIHESDYISLILWDHIFNIEVLYSEPNFAILFFGIAILIFVICAAVDYFFRPIYSFAANKTSNCISLIKGKFKWKNLIIK